MGTAIFMDGFIVASSIAISDVVRHQVDPSGTNVGMGFAAHVFVAFGTIIALRVFLYSFFWYGRGSLADRTMIKPPGFRDFFNCPENATVVDCYTQWWDTLESSTYVDGATTSDKLLYGTSDF